MTKKTANLHVAIDLGGDTLKLAFGYGVTLNGKIEYKYGKLSLGDGVGIPAVAFYNKRDGKWLYGSDVDNCGETDFTTVVPIKSLISLLSSRKNEEIQASNTEYYNSKRIFPKYYLPSERKYFTDLSEAERAGKVFEANMTPKTVCENFFMYVRYLTSRGIERLAAQTDISFEDVEYSVVYPSRSGSKFIEEYERLVCRAFGIYKVTRSVSSVKSLGVYAYRLGKVKDNEPFLVFDIGEEYISVAKLWFVDGVPYIDGADAHKKRERLGGIDIDERIYEYIESELDRREIIATPSASAGGLREGCIDSQKYRFLKEIKEAKHILSSDGEETVLYMCRECYIRRKLARAELIEAIGVTRGAPSDIVGCITDYIVDETRDIVNNDVKKIFMAGGVTETAGLLDCIKQSLSKKSDRKVTVNTFDSVNASGVPSEFSVFENETSVYAAVIGTAMIANEDISIKTVLSLTYGTWGTHGKSIKVLTTIVEKGTPLNETGYTEFESQSFSSEVHGGTYTSDPLVRDDKIYSSVITEKDITERRYVNRKDPPSYRGRFLLLEDGTAQSSKIRKNAEKWYKIDTVVSSDIALYYKGERVSIRSAAGDLRIHYKECITCDPEGHARLKLKISRVDRADGFRTMPYVYVNGVYSPVPINEISIGWVDEPEINMQTNDD